MIKNLKEQLDVYEELVNCNHNLLKEENKKLREALSLVADNIGNGAFASPECSLEFLTVEVPKEVKLVCEGYRRQIECLKLKLL